MKLLLLAGQAVSVEQVREAVGDEVDPADAEVMVLAPAFQDSALRFWVSDADEAIGRAEAVHEETVEELRAGGVHAHGDTGEADPEDAIADALQTFPADRIVIVTSAGSPRYREDIDPAAIEERFGVPTTRLEESA